MKVKFVCIHEDAVVPIKAHETDACYDLFSIEDDFFLAPTMRRAVRTGIVLAIPEGFEGQIRPRSGNALNRGITVLNSPGTTDSGYRGEIKVILYNGSSVNVYIKKNEKIAQIAFRKVYDVDFEEVESIDLLGATDRGEDGFGSTGI